MYKIKIVPVWSTYYNKYSPYPITLKRDSGAYREYNYICTFHSTRPSFEVAMYLASQENNYRFMFRETLEDGDSIVFVAGSYKNKLVFDDGVEIYIPNLCDNSTNNYPDLILEKNKNGVVKLSTNSIDFYKNKIQIINNNNTTDEVIVGVGEIHYSVDGTSIDGEKGLLWETGEEKTFEGNYVINARYIPVRNDKVYTDIYTITNNTKDTLESPILTYNVATESIDIIYDDPDASIILYYEQGDGNIWTLKTGFTKSYPLKYFVKVGNHISHFAFIGIYAYLEVKTSNVKSDVAILDLHSIPEYLIPYYPKINIKRDIVSFDIDEYLNITNVEAYYTLDGTEPTKNSIKYTQPFSCKKKNTVIKVKYFNYNFYSYTTTAVYYYDNNPDIVIYGKPNIEVFGGENKNVEVNGAKCYLDVIFNLEYEKTKILESISYILNEIEQAHAPVNISEEYLNKRFSGNNILIYSDETNSGILDINHKNNNYFDRPNNNQKLIQNIETYKLPYWDKGKWNFNYFRNNITTPVTEDELKGYMSVIYYNPNTNQNEIITRSLSGLKDLYGYNQKENKTYAISDLRSLIYGKYFVLRFIFNADKHIKFNYLSVNTSIKK